MWTKQFAWRCTAARRSKCAKCNWHRVPRGVAKGCSVCPFDSVRSMVQMRMCGTFWRCIHRHRPKLPVWNRSPIILSVLIRFCMRAKIFSRWSNRMRIDRWNCMCTTQKMIRVVTSPLNRTQSGAAKVCVCVWVCVCVFTVQFGWFFIVLIGIFCRKLGLRHRLRLLASDTNSFAARRAE